MMSGAWPPPAPFRVEGVDRAALEGGDRVLDEAGLVQRVGVDHHLHVVARRRPTGSSRWRAGVVPQSSCSFSAQAPARTISSSAPGSEALPLPAKPRFIGKASAASIIRARCQGPGVQVVAKVPVRRAGAAAEHRGDAAHQRLLDLLRADEVDVAVEAAGGEDLALAGDHLGAGADDDVDARLHVRIAGLAELEDAPADDADVAFDDAPVVEDHGVGDDGVDRAVGVRRPGSGPCRRGSPCRRRTSPPRRRW